jgi:hypothetical protein
MRINLIMNNVRIERAIKCTKNLSIIGCVIVITLGIRLFLFENYFLKVEELFISTMLFYIFFLLLVCSSLLYTFFLFLIKTKHLLFPNDIIKKIFYLSIYPMPIILISFIFDIKNNFFDILSIIAFYFHFFSILGIFLLHIANRLLGIPSKYLFIYLFYFILFYG